MTNQEIDRIIAEKVMGWHIACNKCADYPHIDSFIDEKKYPIFIIDPESGYNLIRKISPSEWETWTLSTNITQAFQADDEMAGRGLLLELKRWKYDEGAFDFMATYHHISGRQFPTRINENPATAICLAMIAALEAAIKVIHI